MNYIKGIDVSRWQGTIDWQKVKEDGYKYAAIKITGADDGLYTDRNAIANVQGALRADLIIGGYHYAYFKNVAEAKKEADYFKSVCSNLKLKFMVLDIEYPGAAGDLTQASIAFLDSIGTVAMPLVYAAPSFIREHYNKDITRFPLWIAHYGVTIPAVPLWSKWDIWQYSSTGEVSGIYSDVDLNFMKPEFFKQLEGVKEMKIKVVPSNTPDTGIAMTIARAIGGEFSYIPDVTPNDIVVQIGGGQKAANAATKMIAGADLLDTAKQAIAWAERYNKSGKIY